MVYLAELAKPVVTEPAVAMLAEPAVAEPAVAELAEPAVAELTGPFVAEISAELAGPLEQKHCETILLQRLRRYRGRLAIAKTPCCFLGLDDHLP